MLLKNKILVIKILEIVNSNEIDFSIENNKGEMAE